MFMIRVGIGSHQGSETSTASNDAAGSDDAAIPKQADTATKTPTWLWKFVGDSS